MNADKIIIATATLIALAAFAFKDPILNDIQLVLQIDKLVDKVDKDFDPVQYYPLTLQERSDVIEELLAQMNGLQARISQSTFTKYVVDLHEQIQTLQEALVQLDEEMSEREDYLSFFTEKENGVVASPDFTKDELLRLARLIDEMHPKDADTAYYLLSLEEGSPVLDIPPLSFSGEIHFYQTYADRISTDVFSGERVFLRIAIPDEDEDVVFESHGVGGKLAS